MIKFLNNDLEDINEVIRLVAMKCGSLSNELTSGKFIVPTESYRDEGFSYHYQKPSDYIKITNSEEVSRQFDVLSIPYVNGRTWTTDAIYRETEGNVARRKSDGCISVEMESAGLQNSFESNPIPSQPPC
jgi:uridine phosphorylase